MSNSGFEYHDEYEIIVPRHYQQLGNDYKGMVLNAFQEGSDGFSDDLIFVLMEKVTIQRGIRSIGELEMYSNKPRSFVLDTIDEYKQLVEKCKSNGDFPGGVSAYRQWYRHHSYLRLFHNANPSSEYWEGIRKWSVFKPDEDNTTTRMPADQYVVHDDPLSTSQALQYLNGYAIRIHELELKNYPHSAILIKPIATIDANTGYPEPLGNLYVHFGTINHRPREFYLDLANRFTLVWYRNEGEDLVKYFKETSRDAAVEEQKADQERVQELETRVDAMSPALGEESLNTRHYDINGGIKAYIRSYLVAEEKGKFTATVPTLNENHPVFEQLFKTQVASWLWELDEQNKSHSERFNREAIELDRYDKYWKNYRAKFDNPENEAAIAAFHRILQGRKIYLYCLLFLNYSIPQAHHLVCKGKIIPTKELSKHPLKLETAYNYRLRNLFIDLSVGQTKKRFNIEEKREIYNRCSISEKLSFQAIHRKIQERYFGSKSPYSSAERAHLGKMLSQTIMKHN